MPGSVLVHASAADRGWAQCLVVDLAARGAPARLMPEDADTRAAVLKQAAAVIVVHSWFRPGPDPLDYKRLRCPLLVAQRNWTRLHSDDYPGRRTAVALWDDYYQPRRPGRGKRGPGRPEGGFFRLLQALGLERRADLPPGYAFLSYRAPRDGQFVRDELRPLLAGAGFPSWDYRSSERLPDRDVAVRLESLVRASGCLVVVATRAWWSPWTQLELRLALRHGIPVVAVRPERAHPSGRRVLASYPVVVLDRAGGGREHLVDAVAGTPTLRLQLS
jgi:hypothetical protein